jgi:hypothetical protein
MKLSSLIHWKNLFALWSIQGVAAFIWLLLIPTDTNNPFAFGFSAARLLLLTVALLITILSVSLWYQPTLTPRLRMWKLHHEAVIYDVLYVTGLLVTLAVLGIFHSFSLLPESAAYISMGQRLLPLLLWFGCSGVELAILIAWNRYEQATDSVHGHKAIFRTAILFMFVWGILGLLIVTTKIGITPVENMGGPPVPFLEWQIVLALLVVGIIALFPSLTLNAQRLRWVPLGIYILTVVLWLSQPINTAYFATPPRPPNFEVYPFSDAQIYAEYAQSALAGEGFLWPDVPARPFYVGLLTWLHLLADQNYGNVIILQTLILALFPVLLYMLGTTIGGWQLGLCLSLLTAFRDINSNVAAWIASNVTYSKLFFSELPAALLITLATLLAFRWKRQARQPDGYTLLLGGVLGAAALIRLQSAVLVGVMLLFALIVFPDRKQFLKGALLVTMGFLVVVTPWFIRNYLATGGLVLDNPISQTMTMVRRWGGSAGNEMLPYLPGETDAQYSKRLMGIAFESFRAQPGFILRTATNHFVNSEIASLLAFPLRDQLLSPAELVWPQHSFWNTPVAARQLPLFGFYLFLFTLGLVIMWQRHGLWGLLPLGMGLAYNFSSAVFFSSGVRFIFPLDWSVQLYQLFGLLALIGWFLIFTDTARTSVQGWFEQTSPDVPEASTSSTSIKRGWISAVLLVLLLGGFLPFTENIFPRQYSPKTKTEITQQMGVQPGPGEVALYGRAIYPRYYAANDGEPGTAKMGYEPSEQARLVFFLVGPEQELVIFDLENAPNFFPNTSDVFMIGTQMENYFAPRVVMVTKNGQTVLYGAEKE